MISTLLALTGIMVLNFGNDSQKCAHYVSYDIYQRIFSFGHLRYHNHFVQRVDWIYHFCRLKNKTKQNSLQTFCTGRLSRNYLSPEVIQQFFLFDNSNAKESATDRLNVPTNVKDVPTDQVRTKSGAELAPCPPWVR